MGAALTTLCLGDCGKTGKLSPRLPEVNGKGRQGTTGNGMSQADMAMLSSLSTLKVGPNGAISVFNFDLHNDEVMALHLQRYHTICRHAVGLHVTTSCFTTWRQSKKANSHGKVIPTVSSSGSSASGMAHRVFFFDDNLELDGLHASPGICNLRNVDTGNFVDFAVGKNGFQAGQAGRHTIVLYSNSYNCVLVKANILDAIEDQEYFTNIIEKYSMPDEKIVVFMDVNSTIVCNDSVQSKDMSASLLSTMFELMELTPRTTFNIGWGDCKPVNVAKKCSIKKLVKDITSSDQPAYKSFFSEDNCRMFFDELSTKADIRWAEGSKPLDVNAFMSLYNEYKETISNGIDSDGIVTSWFRCYDKLREGHSLMLNSFGVDTRKVILATDPDENRVLQISVNYELWDKRDVDKFEAQFSDAPPK
jgi:hypothetical protein